MLQMLRGIKTTIYLSDLMHKVGARAATCAPNSIGQTVVTFILADGRSKQQTLPKSAKVIDDFNNGDKHGNADNAGH
jgi:hypothetical protein